jgi:hypothetical protein
VLHPQDPARLGAGEPRASPTSRLLRRQVRRPTLTLADRPLLGGAHENLGWVEGLADLGAARNGNPLVPGGIQAVLDSPIATPRGSPELRSLVRTMAMANPVGAPPRIHGQLLRLGFEVSQRTVSRLMPRGRRPPSQTWRTFLDNHVRDLASIDFFVVPTATFRVLFGFLVLAHDRRRVVHFDVTAHPTAAWTRSSSWKRSLGYCTSLPDPRSGFDLRTGGPRPPSLGSCLGWRSSARPSLVATLSPL